MRFLLVAPRQSVKDSWTVKNFQRFMEDEANFTDCSPLAHRNQRETDSVEHCLQLGLMKMKERLKKSETTPGDDLDDIKDAIGGGDPLAALAAVQQARLKAANDSKAKAI